MTAIGLTASAVVGAGLGVELGRAAIGEINPLYFSAPPAERFFADLTPNRYAATATDQPADFWANDLNSSGSRGCLECAGNLVDPLYAEGPSASALPLEPAVAATPGVAAPTVVAGAAPADVVRYASYPVSQEEALATERPEMPGGPAAGAPVVGKSQPVGM
jgi:hypothetical protein